jgi:hypothetical protein
MKKRKLLSFTLVFTLLFTILVGVNPTVNAANGDYTGTAGFMVNAYPDGVRMNMIPVTGAASYAVYMSTASTLTAANINTASCLFNSGSYQPYSYFTNGDMDKIAATPVTINASTTYYFYYVTNGTTITTRYEVQTQNGGTSWTSESNYDISWYTGSSPYTISTAAQLAGLAYLVNNGNFFLGKTIILGASVDVSAYLWITIGTNGKHFDGTFSGQNNVVNGLYINAATNNQGLFGNVNGAAINNLGVVNGFVQSSADSDGGIVGSAFGSAITSCYNTGSVTATGTSSLYAGGVVGYTYATTITNCYNTGNVTATGASSQFIGGVVGDALSGTVTSCYNTGDVTGAGNDTGGVAGHSGAVVQNCYNTGDVTGAGNNTGGVAGIGGGTFQSCWNAGCVTATGASSNCVGGVMGFVNGITTFTNCCNTGTITATGASSSKVGGVAGWDNSTDITKCYNLGDVTGSAYVGGVTGMANQLIKNSYAHCNVNTAPANIYYNSSGSTSATIGNGTFTNNAAGLANIGAGFCAAPTQYVGSNGVFSSSNKVNNGYPVLLAFGYTGNDSSIDTEFNMGGTGEYLIQNAYQFDLVRNYLQSSDNTKTFRLNGNINISPAQYNQTITGNQDGTDSWKPVGAGVSPFCATFDGNHYSVSGLYIKSSSSNQGLFGNVKQNGGTGGVIETLGVVNGFVQSSANSIGGVVGHFDAGSTIQNCYFIGSVTVTGAGSQYIGGVVGYSDVNSAITSCYNTGSVANTGANCNDIGGVAGYTKSPVQSCYNAGSVSATGPSNNYVGGVVGSTVTVNATITNCYNLGSVVGSMGNVGGVAGNVNVGNATISNCCNTGSVTSEGGNVGGITGYSAGTVTNCNNTGIVTGLGNQVGGIVGYGDTDGTITNCYNIGNVTSAGILAGGVVGRANASVANCYNTGSVTATGAGSHYVGGVAGYSTGTVTSCYYCGYNGGIGNVSNTTATDIAGTIPFAKLAVNSLLTGNSTTVTENAATALNGTSILGVNFAVTYPASYSSTNTSVATTANKTVTAAAIGSANITGTITITQNDLNMASTGWLASTHTINATVSMPLLARTVTGIAVFSQPANLSYTAGQSLALGGLAVTLTYNDNATQNVPLASFTTWEANPSYNITTNPANGTTLSAAHNGTTIAVTCNGVSANTNNLIVTTTPYTATVTVKKDNTAWINGTPTIRLSTSSSALSGAVAGSLSNGIYTFSAPDNTQTYYVWDTTGNQYSAQSVTNSGSSAVLEYYTVNLTTGMGIVSTTGSGAYFSGSNVSINATVSSGYSWSKWTQTTGGADVSTEKNYQITNISAPLSYTANATQNSVPDTTSPLASFPPITLIQTGDVAHGNVQYTTAASVIYALPTSVAVTLVNGSVVTVPVTWTDTDHYDAAVAASYTFTATWGAMPAGANNNNGLATPTVEVTVAAGVPGTSPLAFFTPVTLTQTGDAAHNNVQYTAAVSVIAALPTQVEVTLVNGSVVNVPLTWADTDHYNAGVAASYTFTAAWGAMPAGANNNNNLPAPAAEVTVAAGTTASEPPAPSYTPSSTPPSPATTQSSIGVDIFVNGNRVNAGTAADSTEGGKTVTTITVDQQKLNQKLTAEGNNALVIVPIDSNSDKLVGQLNGQMVKDMEDRQATLEVQTKMAAYKLPASEININAVSAQLGANVTLSNITVQIAIASPSNQTATVVKNAAEDGGFLVTVPAVDFNISCTYNGKTVDVSTFNAYVERTVAIPDGVDPAKITTGVVVSPDGTVRHVPTKVTIINGRYYAVINSLTNSTYTVIWHPLEFADVMTNWAKASINDMGSRMVVNGVGNNNYAPDRVITRAEFAAIIVRALGLAPGTGGNSFKDVEASKWYCGYIKTASTYGIIQGYNADAFGPNDRITREQAMTMIARTMKITGLKPEMKDNEISSLFAKYSDGTASSDFARTGIAACLKTGIITGRSGNTMAPKNYITRAEVAVMVQRLLQKSGLI